MKFGNSRFENTVPVMSATPDYSIGDAVGAPIPINMTGGNNGGVVSSVALTDKANQKPVLTLMFFRALPTGTVTDNAAIALSDADKANFLGKIEVTAADWTTVGSDALATLYGPIVARGVKSSGVANQFTMYLVIMAGAAYNAGSTSDLNVNVSTLMD